MADSDRNVFIQVGAYCEYCGRWCDAGEFHVHHRIPRSIRPDLIKEKTNLIKLCPRCHRLAHSSKEYLEIIKNTKKYDF